MARRVRDYAAEERRRNERSRAAGFTSRAQERRIRREAQVWSEKHARHDVAKFNSRKGSEYVKAYWDAFVNPKTSFQALRHGARTTEEIRHYFVDVMNYMTAEEFDAKYSSGEQSFYWTVKCRMKDGFSRKIFHSEEEAADAAVRHAERRGPKHICTLEKHRA